ncbi:MAG: DUF881 domain-containing protein [Cellulomonadaceae bacterium]
MAARRTPTPRENPPPPEGVGPAAPEAAPDSGQPRPRRSAWQILGDTLRAPLTPTHVVVGLLCGLLGFAVVVQVSQNNDESLSSLRQSDLVRILDESTQRGNELEEQLAALQAQRADLESGTADEASALEAATQRAQTQGILSGRLPAQGSGIEITIVEGSQTVRFTTMLTILEELRNAGAEAVSVDGVRLVASSYFTDTAQGIVADGQLLESPYVWRAIGNPATLMPALEIPGGAMATVRSDGATGSVQERDELVVDAVREPSTPSFASPDTAASGS